MEAERTYTTRGALGTHASHALQGIARGERRLDVAHQHTWQLTLSETLEMIIPIGTKRISSRYLDAMYTLGPEAARRKTIAFAHEGNGES